MKTIAAVSTPPGTGGIGIVRISGDDAVAVADRVFVSKSGRKLSDLKGYSALLGEVYYNGEPVDTCVALVFRSPKSYTGEDVAELSVHGGSFVVKKVLRAVLSAGAEPAGPGEFTKRAFLNGKKDLSSAEAVMNVISASGEAALRASKQALDGNVSRETKRIADELVGISASLAIWTDSPDDDMFGIDTEETVSRLRAVSYSLRKLLDNFDNGRAFTDGIPTVICGKPNAGKSTLMNILSGYDKSIVTDIAGTTRDIVEETVRVGDVILRLSDTAGIRDTADIVESIGVEKAVERIRNSELIIAVFDSSEEPDSNDEKLVEYCKNSRCVAVFNKTDKPKNENFRSFQQSFEHSVVISAKTGEGIEDLKKEIETVLKVSETDETVPMLLNERQYACVRRADEIISRVTADAEAGITFDAVNSDIDCAINALMEITGERATETVVNEVFSKFCVGK